MSWNPLVALFHLSQADERALVVASPHRARWLRWRLLGWWVVLLAGALWMTQHLTGGLPSWLIGVGMGAASARAAMATHARAVAYRSGWLEGRTAMVAALAEAHRRDMHPREWLQAQLEADLALLGIDPGELPSHTGEEGL